MRSVVVVLFFVFFSTSVYASQLIVVVNMHAPGEWLGGNPDYDEYYIYSRLKQRYPISDFLSIRAQNNSQVYHQLSSIIGHSDSIDALVVLSHGDSLFYEIEGKSFFHNIIENNQGFYVYLDDLDSVKSAFLPLMGRFNSNAVIIFEGCSTIQKGALSQKFEQMQKIAQNFGLSSGSLFMHRNSSVNFSDTMIKQPFQKQPSLKRMLATLGFQLTSWISYPLFWLQEHYRYNKGYTLKIFRNMYFLYEDDYFNVQQRSKPTGDFPLIYGRVSSVEASMRY